MYGLDQERRCERWELRTARLRVFAKTVAFLYREVGLSEFTEEVVARSEAQAMIARVHFGVNPVAEAAGYDKMTTIIDIHMRDGRTISGRVILLKAARQIPCLGTKWPRSFWIARHSPKVPGKAENDRGRGRNGDGCKYSRFDRLFRALNTAAPSFA